MYITPSFLLWSRNRDQQEVQLYVGAFEVMSSRMSPRASHRRHFLPPAFFVYKFKTSAFVTGKCHLKVKSAGGTCVLMAYFGHAHWRKGDKFSRESNFLVNLYSVLWWITTAYSGPWLLGWIDHCLSTVTASHSKRSKVVLLYAIGQTTSVQNLNWGFVFTINLEKNGGLEKLSDWWLVLKKLLKASW